MHLDFDKFGYWIVLLILSPLYTTHYTAIPQPAAWHKTTACNYVQNYHHHYRHCRCRRHLLYQESLPEESGSRTALACRESRRLTLIMSGSTTRADASDKNDNDAIMNDDDYDYCDCYIANPWKTILNSCRTMAIAPLSISHYKLSLATPALLCMGHQY